MPPPKEAVEVVRLFDLTADALLRGEIEQADSLIALADIASLYDHAQKLWGSSDPKIHRWSVKAAYKARTANLVPKAERDKADPGVPMKREIFKRDGWHCLYCGILVMSAEAFKALKAFELPALRWGDTNKDQHLGATLIWGVLDHVVPLSAGGRTNPENLVTSCWLCNGAKWNATLGEAELNDPRSRLPIMDDWDGLTRLCHRG